VVDREAIAAGLDVDAADDATGQTALMLAACNGHKKVVAMLLKAKAKKNLRSACMQNGDPDTHTHTHTHAAVQRLVAGTDKAGQSALLQAASHGHDEIVRVLIKARAKLNSKDKDDRTALMVAAASGSTAACAVLLEADATDIDARDKV
jgi:uncharacterized protein